MAIRILASTSLDVLADALARALEDDTHDPLAPRLILTPNMPLRRWLTYHLAERLGIVANIRFQFLEEGLWSFTESLGAQDAEVGRAERLKREWIQWMIAGVILASDPGDESLSPLFAYTGALGDLNDRAAMRKLWQLSEQISRLFREYESAAPELTRNWLAAAHAPHGAAPMWRAQRALYRALFAKGGVRDRLTADTRALTTVEFINERLERLGTGRTVEAAVLRIFCIPAMGRNQTLLLERLGEYAEIEIYHLDVLSGAHGPLAGLVQRWGLAHAARRDWLAARSVSRLPQAQEAPTTRLCALHCALRAESPPESIPSDSSDSSLQLLACPGVRREVEAVRDSIIHLLETQPDLKLTDIGVLVSDMTQYRSHLEAVFQREDVRVPFNLSDTTAEDDSVFAQGVEALLALAGGRFTRREFFNLALNPCFLTAQKLSRDDAMQWLDWADRLNVFREIDAGSRAELQPFSWRHALRRLRLGRVMSCGSSIQAYRNAVPFGDLRSSNPEAVTAFSAVVERLARFCERCAAPRGASEWSTLLQEALAEFVAVPEDRLEEESVRNELYRALEEFRVMDAILAAGGSPRRTLAFPLLRELVVSSIADISSRYGHYLLGGVTISALRPDRPVPFRVAFVLGMGEGVFPGHDAPVSLDVRDPLDTSGRLPGAVEANRAALLEVLVSTRARLVFSYVARNLQKDETFEPTTLLKELEEAAPFARLERVEIPFTGASENYVFSRPGAPALPCYHRQDLLHVLSRLALDAGVQAALAPADRLRFSRLQEQVRESLELRRFDIDFPQTDKSGKVDAEAAVTIEELMRFLKDPLTERLRRHLGLFDDDREDARALEEHEPFHIEGPESGKLIRDALETAVVKGNEAPIPQTAALAAQQQFQERQWLGSAPSGEYGRLGRARIEETLTATVERPFVCEGLSRLKRIAGVTIGRRVQGADHVAFPTLRLRLSNGRVVRVTGQMPHVYQSRIGGPLEFLTVTNKHHRSHIPSSFLLQQWLFYMALSAGDEIDAQGRTSRQWLREAGCNAWLLTSNGLLGWRYAAPSLEEARDYLTRLLEAYLDTTRFENLPLEIVLKLYEKEGSAHTAPPPDFPQRLQRELERSEVSDFGYSQAPFYRILRVPIPKDAIALFFQRIRPFLNGVELDPRTDLAELLDEADRAEART